MTTGQTGTQFMSSRKPAARNTSSLLRETSMLRRLTHMAVRLTRLQSALEQYLQPAARPWCRVASLEDGCLLLVVSNAQWATHLRYQQQRLLRQLQGSGEFGNLSKILLKVQPTIGEQDQRPAPDPLPSSAAQSLRDTASKVASPQLRAALERLSQHTAQDKPEG